MWIYQTHLNNPYNNRKLKNKKLEKWNEGMQKGITQYVKENYDEEREA